MDKIVQVIIRAVDQTRSGLTQSIGNFKEAQSAIDKLRPAAVAAATAAAASFAALSKQFLNTADDISKLSQKTGFATEFLSGLNYAASLSGTSLEQVKVSLKTFASAITEANTKGGETKAIFDALGISLTDSDGKLKSSQALFMEVSTAMSRYQDGAEKSAVATKLFGRSGSELIPLLNNGAAGIGEMIAEAERLGVTFSAKTGKEAEAFNDNITRLWQATKGFVAQIVSQVLPSLVEFSNWFVKISTDGETLAGVIGTIVDFLKGLIAAAIGVAEAFALIGRSIGTLLGNFTGEVAKAIQLWVDAFGKLKSGEFKEAGEAFKRAFLDGNAISAFARAAGTSFDDIKADATKTFDDIAARWQKLYTEPPKAKAAASAVNDDSRPAMMLPGLDAAAMAKAQAEVQRFLEQLAGDFEKATSTQLQLVQLEYERRREFIEKNIADEQQRAAALEQLEIVRATKADEIREQERAKIEAHQAALLQAEVESYRAIEDVRNALTAASLEGVALLQFEEDIRFQKQLEQIAQLRLTEDEAMRLSLQANQNYQAALRRIEEQANKQRMMNVSQYFGYAAQAAGNFAQASMAFGKKGAQAQKIFMSAQAIMSALAGATRAYADVPWPLNIAVSASILAAGMANVAQINSTPIGQAHGGLDYVPESSTYLLKQGERVLAPNQNAEMMEMIQAYNSTPRSAGVISINVGGRSLGDLIYEISRTGELRIDSRALA